MITINQNDQINQNLPARKNKKIQIFICLAFNITAIINVVAKYIVWGDVSKISLFFAIILSVISIWFVITGRKIINNKINL